MNFRVGQKVICVGHGRWSCYGRAPYVPVTGGIYTIRWTGVCSGHPCLRFHELINPPYRWRDGFLECAFRIQNRDGAINFRPLVTRKTDISIFQRMLVPAGKRDLVKG
jgi:hypothetical protein